MRSDKLIAALASTLVSVGLFGCAPGGPKGRDLPAEAAPAFFQSHRAALEAIVALVDVCRPVGKDGDNVVWREQDPTSLHCARGNDEAIRDLQARLAALDAVAVSYYAADASKTHAALAPLRDVNIVLSTSGLGVSGSMTDVSYSAAPRTVPMTVERRHDGSVLSTEKALTTAPFHWFWRRTS